jgi:hypothetical protein
MKESLETLRHQLASINLKDMEDVKPMSEDEREKYCATISSAFPYLERDLKEWMYHQLLYASNQAENWEKVMYARGTFNGLHLIWQYWQKAANEHKASAKEDKEEFDKNKPIAEI